MWHPDIPEEYRNQIVTGDARELAKRIPDESVDLIFTDPVYDRIDDYRWLAETAVRVLRPGGDVLVYLAHYHMDKVIIAMVQFLDFRWLIVEKKMTSGALIWSLNLFSHYIPLLWLTKGKPRKGLSRMDFKWSQGEGKGVNHKWSKGSIRAAHWLERFSLYDDIVWEPFCGGGNLVSACKLAGRNYIAFEIDPATAEAARERVLNTQPPLFVLEPEQMELELGA